MEQPVTPMRTVSLRVPLSRPWATYVLLAFIGVAFAAQTLRGGSTNGATLIELGAQVNTMVADGELWRLLSAMFLHIGLSHILFNGWALFSVGREVESFFGVLRFGIIYFLAGLAGNIAYYVAGREGLSAGASGAVFGIIGAEAAYFLINRSLFGAVGRQRLGNLAVLIGINLVFGFTVPGINNLAHLGGLISGVLLGLGLAPRYMLDRGNPLERVPPRVINRHSFWIQAVTVLVTFGMLMGGLQLGNQRWQGSAVMLRTQAEAAYGEGDLTTAQALLEQATSLEPNDRAILFNLGVIYIQQNRPDMAVEVLERARAVGADDPNTLFTLGVAYVATSQLEKGRALLEQFLALESSGERASYAEALLAEIP
jgi:rhomboid protease GluP